jgi:hypothetical protein
LREILNHLEEPEVGNRNIDGNNRMRDEKCRFLPIESSLEIKEVSPSKSDSPKKIIRIAGSYNFYVIKDNWFTEGEIDALIVFAILGVLAIIF